MLTLTLGMLHVAARDMQHSRDAVTVNGIVKDAHTKKKLANVSVHLQGSDIGTATNGDGMFDDETIPLYSFKHEQMMMLDDRLHYAVSFKPCATAGYPLYSGTLYIDSESLCLTRAEITLDVSDREKTNRALLQRKPLGLRFRCREASITVAYRQHDGRACLDYIRNTIRFKCDWKRRLFSSTYNTVAEMVTVDLDSNPAANIPYSESYRDNRMFYDDARQNWDADFWQDYNIIEPTESLEKAVAKLRKHNKKDK